MPQGQTERGGIVSKETYYSVKRDLVQCSPSCAAPMRPMLKFRGGVTRQGVVLTDLESLLDVNKLLSLSLSPSFSLFSLSFSLSSQGSELLATFYTLFLDYIHEVTHDTHAAHASHLHRPTQLTIHTHTHTYSTYNIYIYIILYIYIYIYIYGVSA